MVEIFDKHNCCGCEACVQACPKRCISFDEDEQGFRYPLVNKEECIDCGLCEKVCPCLNQNESRKPLKVYAAINPNETIRMKSSSGGIFTMLAETIIDDGGVVFGARFDENWEVIHDYTETKEGLEAFRGSKYVQSRIGETYKQAHEFLNAGRKVLFSGTSCQIAGLKKFLRKEYDNLLTVDVICHGVPSPLVWRTYLKELIEHPKGVIGGKTVLSTIKEKPIITGISFRDKTNGWKKFGFVVRGKSASEAADQNSVLSSIVDESNELLRTTFDKDLYMQAFLRNLSIRPSCYNCHSKSGKSRSDISLADFWGYNLKYTDWADDKGVSLVLAYTEKGKALLASIDNIAEADYYYALKYNPVIVYHVNANHNVGDFWNQFNASGFLNMRTIINRYTPSLFARFKGLIRRKINKK